MRRKLRHDVKTYHLSDNPSYTHEQKLAHFFVFFVTQFFVDERFFASLFLLVSYNFLTINQICTVAGQTTCFTALIMTSIFHMLHSPASLFPFSPATACHLAQPCGHILNFCHFFCFLTKHCRDGTGVRVRTLFTSSQR